MSSSRAWSSSLAAEGDTDWWQVIFTCSRSCPCGLATRHHLTLIATWDPTQRTKTSVHMRRVTAKVFQEFRSCRFDYNPLPVTTNPLKHQSSPLFQQRTWKGRFCPLCSYRFWYLMNTSVFPGTWHMCEGALRCNRSACATNIPSFNVKLKAHYSVYNSSALSTIISQLNLVHTN